MDYRGQPSLSTEPQAKHMIGAVWTEVEDTRTRSRWLEPGLSCSPRHCLYLSEDAVWVENLERMSRQTAGLERICGSNLQLDSIKFEAMYAACAILKDSFFLPALGSDRTTEFEPGLRCSDV